MKNLWKWVLDTLNHRPLPRNPSVWDESDLTFVHAVREACAGIKLPGIRRYGLERALAKLLNEKGELAIEDADVQRVLGRGFAWRCLEFELRAAYQLLDYVEEAYRGGELVTA